MRHNPRCAIFHDPPSLRDASACNCGAIPPLHDPRAALTEAAALLETAERDGYVSAGWREDARTWRNCWQDVIVNG